MNLKERFVQGGDGLGKRQPFRGSGCSTLRVKESISIMPADEPLKQRIEMQASCS